MEFLVIVRFTGYQMVTKVGEARQKDGFDGGDLNDLVN